MPPLSGPVQRALLDQVLQIPGRGRARCAGDGDVILGAEPALEPLGALSEHALDHLGLPVVQLIAELAVELRLGDEEGNPHQCDLLCVEHRLAEPQKPRGHIQRLLVGFELVVIALAVAFDRVGQCDQARLTDILRKGLFSQSAAQAAIAVLERMDTLEPQVPKSRARQCW